jgi:KUP system potassium uptake protein
VPRVPDSARLDIDELGYRDDGITFVRAKYGYFEKFNVPALIRLIDKAGVECPLEADQASYFLSKIELKPTDAPGMSRWRKELFLATATISAEPADYFRLPRERTVFIGSEIEF